MMMCSTIKLKIFKENINNPSIHSAILHNVYRDLRKGYEKIIKNYILNRCSLLKKEYNKDKL